MKNMNVCVKFDDLKMQKLLETFRYGAKLLCLFFQFENNNLYFENTNDGEVDVIPLPCFLQQIQNTANIEILILCCSDGQ